MPELPEVETVARQLQQQIGGRTIRSIEVRDPKLGELGQWVPNPARIVRVYRYGKQVALELEENRSLLIHLRMSGRLLVGPEMDLRSSLAGAHELGSYLHRVAAAEKHIRACFELDRCTLFFVDARRFGTIKLYRSDELPAIGRDPLDPRFTPAELDELLTASQQPLKQWLLRQDRLVGVGNIYASEALHRAGLHPELAAARTGAAGSERLFVALREILEQAIAHGGTTVSDFQQSDGSSGGYGALLRVYEREGDPCMQCGRAIQRLVQGGRSTYFCSGCQPKRRPRKR